MFPSPSVSISLKSAVPGLGFGDLHIMRQSQVPARSSGKPHRFLRISVDHSRCVARGKVSCPGVAACTVGRPHHSHAACAIPQDARDQLVACNVFSWLLTPRIPVSVHLMSIANHEAGSSLNHIQR